MEVSVVACVAELVSVKCLSAWTAVIAVCFCKHTHTHALRLKEDRMFWRTTHDIVMEQVLIRRNDSLCFQAGNVISVQKKKKKKKERKATV